MFLDGKSFSFGFHFSKFDLALGTSSESSDLLSELSVLIEVSSEGSSKVVGLTFVFLSHVSDGYDSSVLLMDKSSESSFSADEAVGDVHFAAKSGEPGDKLNGVDVVGNDDQLGLFLLDESGDVVESELEMVGLGVLDLFFWIDILILSALNLASATNRALRCLAS